MLMKVINLYNKIYCVINLNKKVNVFYEILVHELI